MQRLRALALVAVLGLTSSTVLAGCGSAPEASPPAGVDGLQIPTPSPRAADFVAGVDNPWLALEPGTVWTYRVDDPDSAPAELTLTLTVPGRTRTVAGIDATVVEETLTDARGARVEHGECWLAQDVHGNVWLMGRSGSWQAGVAGARAGLVMPARPRVGDGFREALAPGVAEVRVSITDLDASRTTPADAFSDLLETEVSSDAGQVRTTTKWYAAGTGLLAEQDVTGGVRTMELVSVERP